MKINRVANRIRVFIVDIVMILATIIVAFPYSLCDSIDEVALLKTIAWMILIVNLLAGRLLLPRLCTIRLSVLQTGLQHLLVFCISSLMILLIYVAGICKVFLALENFKNDNRSWIICVVVTVLVESLVFWSGMLRVFFTSEQLAIKWRIVAVLCGLLPIVNIIVLLLMMKIVSKEVQFENDRLWVNINRKDERICETKYPIVMIHGIFFRDFKYLNYWGRIPKALEENGAKIYYGNHHSAQSVTKCGQELVERLKQICEKSGCEKVNIIAHSKGGLDMRYAISQLGADKYVASLTTINTPHRGCEFAEYLLTKIPEQQKNAVASKYNAAFKKLGDEEPDFIEGVTDLTYSFCEQFNVENKDSDNVYYQSVGSIQDNAISGRFPLNMSYLLVKHFDGPNDGLVGEKSFPWGERYQCIKTKGRRGVSHGDMIDLNRENIPGFDVREFYIQLVYDLKKRGY